HVRVRDHQIGCDLRWARAADGHRDRGADTDLERPSDTATDHEPSGLYVMDLDAIPSVIGSLQSRRVARQRVNRCRTAAESPRTDAADRDLLSIRRTRGPSGEPTLHRAVNPAPAQSPPRPPR